MAHQHVILQMVKELGTAQALKYDQEFREWAAAKDQKKWGELNFPIYARCLANSSNKSAPPVPLFKGAGVKRKSLPELQFCYKWNFEDSCNWSPCRFEHRCLHCGGAHRAKHCLFHKA